MSGLRHLAFLACTFAFAAAAQAGFDEGEQAFKRRDYRSALTKLTSLADGADARAQYYLGVMFVNGLGVPRDDARGADYVARSAARDYAPAVGVTGDLPQDVNFAINGATLQSFLEANSVAFRSAPPAGAVLSAADVGEQAARYTVAIECAR